MATMIDKKQWRIAGELRHGGFVFSTGEPPPDMSVEDALRFREAGVLLRVGEHPLDVQTERFLAIADDAALLRELRPPARPEVPMLRALLERAIAAERSTVLVEALRLLVREPRT